MKRRVKLRDVETSRALNKRKRLYKPPVGTIQILPKPQD